VGDIDHGQPQILAHLRRGESHAVGRDHRVEHVADELDNFIIDLRHGTAALTKDRVAVLDNFEDHGELEKSLAKQIPKVQNSVSDPKKND
jgi:hypothetical protein